MFRISLALLLAGSTAWSQDETYDFEWTLGTESGGYGNRWMPSDLRATTLEEGSKRRPGPAQATTYSLELGMCIEAVVQEWMRSALDAEAPVRDIDLIELKYDKSVKCSTRFQGSRITEIFFPAISSQDQFTNCQG